HIVHRRLHRLRTGARLGRAVWHGRSGDRDVAAGRRVLDRGLDPAMNLLADRRNLAGQLDRPAELDLLANPHGTHPLDEALPLLAVLLVLVDRHIEDGVAAMARRDHADLNALLADHVL